MQTRMEEGQSVKQMVLAQLDIHRKPDEVQPKPHTLYKHKLKLDHRFKYKAYDHTILKRKHTGKSLEPTAW